LSSRAGRRRPALASELDVYMRRFTDTSGQPVFYSALSTRPRRGEQDPAQGLVLNAPGSTVGKKTLESRLQEPHIRPWSDEDVPHRPGRDERRQAKLSMAFRVTDAGELEVVRTTRHTFARRRVCGGRIRGYRSSLDGATNVVPPQVGVPLPTLRALRACLASWRRSRTETTTSELIDGPQGLQLTAPLSRALSAIRPPPYSGYVSQRASP
jgi:hypothetical protein